MTEKQFMQQIEDTEEWVPIALAFSDWLEERGDPRARGWRDIARHVELLRKDHQFGWGDFWGWKGFMACVLFLTKNNPNYYCFWYAVNKGAEVLTMVDDCLFQNMLVGGPADGNVCFPHPQARSIVIAQHPRSETTEEHFYRRKRKSFNGYEFRYWVHESRASVEDDSRLIQGAYQRMLENAGSPVSLDRRIRPLP